MNYNSFYFCLKYGPWISFKTILVYSLQTEKTIFLYIPHKLQDRIQINFILSFKQDEWSKEYLLEISGLLQNFHYHRNIVSSYLLLTTFIKNQIYIWSLLGPDLLAYFCWTIYLKIKESKKLTHTKNGHLVILKHFIPWFSFNHEKVGMKFWKKCFSTITICYSKQLNLCNKKSWWDRLPELTEPWRKHSTFTSGY